MSTILTSAITALVVCILFDGWKMWQFIRTENEFKEVLRAKISIRNGVENVIKNK